MFSENQRKPKILKLSCNKGGAADCPAGIGGPPSLHTGGLSLSTQVADDLLYPGGRGSDAQLTTGHCLQPDGSKEGVRSQ